uniref:Uncharacterized protein n=1 Tax=Arundo donax TaxID=35708 RepID=A0A0A8Z621_ARUDO
MGWLALIQGGYIMENHRMPELMKMKTIWMNILVSMRMLA